VAGKASAVRTGAELEDQVAGIVLGLGLEVERQVRVGRRIWGAERRIDIIAKDPSTRTSLGIECKYQGIAGSAEEKIPATIQDIEAWPIRGIVVFAGQGFSERIKYFLLSTGKAMEVEDLATWLKLYFGL